MKTAFLMTALTVLLVLIGDYFGGLQGMIVMLSFSVIMNFYAYWNSDKMVLRHYNAREVDAQSAPALYKMVQELARRGNLPMPKVYIIDSPVPNAFATGRNPEHAAVAVTTALYDVLDKREIAGVLGHELSHVKHNDILISTIAATNGRYYYNHCPVGHVPRRRPQRRRGQQRRQLYRYFADYDSGAYCCGLNSNGCIPLPRIHG